MRFKLITALVASAGVTGIVGLTSCGKKEPVASEVNEVEKTKPVETPVIPEPVIKEKDDPDKDTEPEVVETDNKEPSKMEKLLSGKTVYIKDNTAVRSDSKKGVKQYFLLYTGSWCATTKKNLPKIKQFYHDHIKDVPHREFILVSNDDTSAVIKWAIQENFEWPMLLKEELSQIDFLNSEAENYGFYFPAYSDKGESLNCVTLDDCLKLISAGGPQLN